MKLIYNIERKGNKMIDIKSLYSKGIFEDNRDKLLEMSKISDTKENKKLIRCEKISINGIYKIELICKQNSVHIYKSDFTEMLLCEYKNDKSVNYEKPQCKYIDSKIKVEYGEDTNSFFETSENSTIGGIVEIYLPETYLGGLEISTSTGNIDVCFSFELLDLTAISINGNIVAGAGKCKNLSFTSDNGKIIFKDIKAGNILITTNHGKINFRSLIGESVCVTTDDGKINFRSIEAEEVLVTSDSGNINYTFIHSNKETINTDIGIITHQEL